MERAGSSLLPALRRWRWAKRLRLPSGQTMFCDHCGSDLLAYGHKKGCVTQ